MPRLLLLQVSVSGVGEVAVLICISGRFPVYSHLLVADHSSILSHARTEMKCIQTQLDT